MKKNNKGITLIALVITIIVLLILAGVTVASLSGENGLLTRGSQAVNNSNISDAEEKVTLAFDDAMSAYYDAKYVTNTVNNQAEAPNAPKWTPVAWVANYMMSNPDFSDNARFVTKAGDISSEGEKKSITGNETEIIIQLTEVRQQETNQTESATPVIETKIVSSGNAAKLEFSKGQKWGAVAVDAGE